MLLGVRHKLDDDPMNFVYDIETMKNLFSCCIVSMETGNRWIYEVSPRKSQAARFINAIRHLRSIGARLVGFNNEGFDWWVVQNLIALGDFSALDAYNLGQQVIQSQDRFVVALGTVAQMKPDSLDKLDADAWLDDYADRLGLEPGVLVGGRRLAMIRESRAQAQAQAAQAAQAEQTAAAAQKLGTVQTGAGASNAANDVINMFSGYTGPRGEAA